MHKNGVVHRDLKLENILVDKQMNVRLVDFGFSTYNSIDKLTSFKGTKVYMAPEIKEQKVYDGRQIDVFSSAILLFAMVHGIFPFKQASLSDKYYNLMTEDPETYWDTVGDQDLSSEFKDLLTKMLRPNGKDRPTMKEVLRHPWMTQISDDDHERIRHQLIELLSADNKTFQSNTSAGSGSTDATDQTPSEIRGEEDPCDEFHTSNST